MSGAPRLAAACALLTLPVLAAGCVERRIFITSEPAGALVQLNDVEVGRTPLEIDFEWHGVYDVLLTLEGHEPLRTTARADAPIYEWPGFDLVAAALPMTFRNHIHWRFELEPLDRDQDALLERARALRETLHEAHEPPSPDDAP
ncbi:MAG: PEGA domain-containing protein [Phycisphaerales bacterium]|nr:MAG: PEGA domain-containing protein [Phycisphaerales bacterium]